MKQILQNLKTGETELTDIPCPQVKSGHLLIKTNASVVSAGTEKMLVDFGKSNLLNKARQQPDKVRQVLDKVKTDGVLTTMNAVQTKLDQPLPLGYSNAGVVLEVGKGVEGFSVGDRVVSNGKHAEVVCVPKNLCTKIPDNVADESAAFTVIGAIALQGIRLAEPTLGESFVVVGLGLIGLITVQLLKAQGCRVLGVDFDSNKLNLAKQFGAQTVDLSKGEDPVAIANSFSKGRGVDGVLITAATKSNEPVHQAAQMCRKRGKIILVGVAGLELSREDFFEKELTFQVSCSYGPGRYDPDYEEKGNDYPFGFVRWTEQRNFEAILDMLSEGKLDIESLITHRFDIDNALKAYELLGSKENYIGIVLNYPDKKDNLNDNLVSVSKITTKNREVAKNNLVSVGIIGAGNFTNQTLLPAIKKNDVQLKTIACSGGLNGAHVGKRFGFENATTEVENILRDEEINTVFVTTRHDSHAHFAKEALKEGKNVFVEKPLCVNRDELKELEKIDYRNGQVLLVGFNRRFSPYVIKMKELLNTIHAPKTMVMMVNAGFIPSDHWVQDPEAGGGRIIGEACHFIDLLRFLVGSNVIDVKATMLGESPGVDIREDKMSFTLSFKDGSIGTVHYFANGHNSFPKERLEVFCGGKILALDNFRLLQGYGWSNFKKMKLRKQDKGHYNEVKAFIESIQNGQGYPIPLEEIFEVTRTSFDVIDSAKS